MLSKVMTRSRASVQISDSQFVPQCVLGHDICNRWKIVARPELEPRAFLLTVRTLYHWATEPPGHLTNNFSLELYPFTHFPGHFKFVHEFPVGKSTISYILPRRTYRLTTSPQWVFYVGSHLSYRATRSSHQQLFTWTLPGYIYPYHTSTRK